MCTQPHCIRDCVWGVKCISWLKHELQDTSVVQSIIKQAWLVNAFEYDIRAIYGGALFDNRAKNCFCVTGTIGAQKKVTNITLTMEAGTNQVPVGDTVKLNVAVTPTDAYNKAVTFSIINGTGKATVDNNGVVTGVEVGNVTAVASATDGSGVQGTCEIPVVSGKS